MSLTLLTDDLWFPSADKADQQGLLAIGGDLSAKRLLLAYKNGIFPWFNEDEPPLWWCPDPRCVLFPEQVVISKSMQQLIRKKTFTVTVNTAFERVIRSCGATRRHREGTWITEDIINAYTQLHRQGYAVSVEAWQGTQLAGGLYGIRLGGIFFGESMFSSVSNASKYALIQYMLLMQEDGGVITDCQIYTPHLESMGARMISRAAFLSLLRQHLPQ